MWSKHAVAKKPPPAFPCTHVKLPPIGRGRDVAVRQGAKRQAHAKCTRVLFEELCLRLGECSPLFGGKLLRGMQRVHQRLWFDCMVVLGVRMRGRAATSGHIKDELPTWPVRWGGDGPTAACSKRTKNQLCVR